jgi:hypothetical protein
MKKILIISPFKWDVELYPHLKELIDNLSYRFEIEYYFFNERGFSIEEYSSNFKKNLFSKKGYLPIFKLIKQILLLIKFKSNYKHQEYKILAIDNFLFSLSSILFGANRVCFLSFDFIAINNTVRSNILQKIIRFLTNYFIKKSFIFIIQTPERAEAFFKSINYNKSKPNIFYLPVCLNRNVYINEVLNKEIKFENLKYIQIGGINEYRSNSISILMNFNFKNDKLIFHGYINESVKWIINKNRYNLSVSEKILSTEELTQKIINDSDVGILSYSNKDDNFNLLALASGQFAEFMRCNKPVIVIGDTTLTHYVNKLNLGIGIFDMTELPKAQNKMLSEYNLFLQNIKLFNQKYNLLDYTNSLIEKIF